MQHHLDPSTFQRLVDLELEREGLFDHAWHLFVCGPCRERLVAALPAAGPRFLERLFAGSLPLDLTVGGSETKPSFERAFETLRSYGAALERERTEAPRLAAELDALAESWRFLAVKRHERFRTYGLAQHLIARAAAARDRPRAAEADARLALAMADHLDRRRHGATLLADLRGRAWAMLANALRLEGDPSAAEGAFRRSEELLAQGSRDLAERAHLLSLRAWLLADQHRWDEAEAHLVEAAGLYHRVRDQPREAGVRIRQAALARLGGRPREATNLLEEAASLLDPGADRALLLRVQCSLLLGLAELGRADSAADRLPVLRRLAEQEGGRLAAAQLAWVEGRLAARTGRGGEAIDALRRARDGFAAEGAGYDAALAALELVTVLLADAPGADLRSEIDAVFACHDLGRGALAALGLFRQALERRSVTADLARDLAGYLERARSSPGLGHEEPS